MAARKAWGIFLPLFPLYFTSCWPDLWNKQKHCAEEWNHQIRGYVKDLGSCWNNDRVCKHYRVWKPDAQASRCWKYESVHLLCISKANQVDSLCESCKNHYTKNGDSVRPIQYDWQPDSEIFPFSFTKYIPSVLRGVSCHVKNWCCIASDNRIH